MIWLHGTSDKADDVGAFYSPLDGTLTRVPKELVGANGEHGICAVWSELVKRLVIVVKNTLVAIGPDTIAALPKCDARTGRAVKAA
jgi:hypothetical protein